MGERTPLAVALQSGTGASGGSADSAGLDPNDDPPPSCADWHSTKAYGHFVCLVVWIIALVEIIMLLIALAGPALVAVGASVRACAPRDAQTAVLFYTVCRRVPRPPFLYVRHAAYLLALPSPLRSLRPSVPPFTHPRPHRTGRRRWGTPTRTRGCG